MKVFDNIAYFIRSAILLGRTGAVEIGQHWGLALFSLATAFAIWFAVQDVQNPRTEGIVPVDGQQRIPVQAVNVPEGYIALSITPVSVRVRGREDDLPLLRSADFQASVDVKGLSAGEQTAPLPVTVTSRRDNIDVVSVSPATVQVTLVQAATEEIPITFQTTGSVPEGFREIVDERSVDPGFVTVTGLPELVESIKNGGAVVVVVNLSGMKAETNTIDAELIARNASGNTVSVTMSAQRARVTIRVEQIISTRILTLEPVITGTPATGFGVANVRIDPPTIGVSGTDPVLESLGTTLRTVPVDVTGAKGPVTREVAIDQPQNVTLDRESVSVIIDIKPIQCGGSATGTACGTALIPIALASPTDLPQGLSLEAAVYTVYVEISAPVETITTLESSDFRATVSFANALAGTTSYTPEVTGPTGVTIVSVQPINIRLIPAVTGP